jgi:hypothetical protein
MAGGRRLKDSYAFLEEGGGGGEAGAGAGAGAGSSAAALASALAANVRGAVSSSSARLSKLLGRDPDAAEAAAGVAADGEGGGAAGAAANGVSAAPPWLQKLDALFALTWMQRMSLFALCAAGGAATFSLAFMYMPLLLVGRSVKFAMAYSLANALLILSSCFLVGPARQVASMTDSGRLGASGVYLATLLATLYCAVWLPSAFLLVPLVVAQLCSLVWYVASYFPYGRACIARTSQLLCRRPAMALSL